MPPKLQQLEPFSLFLEIVASIRQDIVSSLDFIKHKDEPGSYQLFGFRVDEGNQHPAGLRGQYNISINLVRSTVQKTIEDYKKELIKEGRKFVSPCMVLGGTIARFGVGECHEHVVEFARRVMQHNISGKLYNIAVGNLENKNSNHTFLIYVPNHIEIPDPQSNAPIIPWLENIPENSINEAILIDPWRDMVMPLKNKIQREKLIHLIKQAQMDCLLACTYESLIADEKQKNAFAYINDQIENIYAKTCETLQSKNYIFSAKAITLETLFTADNKVIVPEIVSVAKRDRFLTSEAVKILNTTALHALRAHSKLCFFGVARKDYTVDAIAELRKEEMFAAEKLATTLGGEIYAINDRRFLLLLKGINVSSEEKKGRRPDEVHALAEEIRALKY